MRLSFIVHLMLAFTLSAPVAAAGEGTLAGPVPAEVERVVDGDTLAVRAQIWLDQDVRVLVRLRGIDAPEGRARCEEERRLAARAKAYLTAAVSGGPVTLSAVEGGKYHGRVLADVTTAEGRDVSGALLRTGLARPYGGAKRGTWCANGR